MDYQAYLESSQEAFLQWMGIWLIKRKEGKERTAELARRIAYHAKTGKILCE